MESVSLEGSAISLTSFIFTFVQRIFYAYYEWFVDQLDYLIKNWFDFSFKKATKFSLHVDPLTRQYLEVTPQPKHVTIPVDTEAARESLVSLTLANVTEEDTKNFSEENKTEKTENELWLNIKEIVKYKEELSRVMGVKEKKVAEAAKINEYKEIKRCNNKRGKESLDYVAGATIKLSDYNKKNQEYLLNKYTNGSNVDNFSFTHPEAHSIFSRTFSVKSPVSKNLRRRPRSFRPTELSTIFENLAY